MIKSPVVDSVVVRPHQSYHRRFSLPFTKVFFTDPRLNRGFIGAKAPTKQLLLALTSRGCCFYVAILYDALLAWSPKTIRYRYRLLFYNSFAKAEPPINSFKIELLGIMSSSSGSISPNRRNSLRAVKYAAFSSLGTVCSNGTANLRKIAGS